MTFQWKIVAVILILSDSTFVTFPQIPSLHGSREPQILCVLHRLLNHQGCVPAVGRCCTHAHTRSSGEIPSLTLVETNVSASHALIPSSECRLSFLDIGPLSPGHALMILIPGMCVFVFRGSGRGLILIWLNYAYRPGSGVSWARADAGQHTRQCTSLDWVDTSRGLWWACHKRRLRHRRHFQENVTMLL